MEIIYSEYMYVCMCIELSIEPPVFIKFTIYSRQINISARIVAISLIKL